MAQIRKTRQQKIQISQRRADQVELETVAKEAESVPLANNAILAQEMAKPSLAIDTHIQATYLYAQEELRRIGWISLLCLGLLLLCSVFLSEMPAFVQLRELLNLPHLSPFSN